MKGYVHVLFAVDLLIVASILLKHPLTAIGFPLVILGGLFPDLDYPNSLISAPIYNISLRIRRTFGRRGLLHSPLIFGALWLLTDPLSEYIYVATIPVWFVYPNVFFLGVCSHIILDMFTPDGVRLFPFQMRAVWNKLMFVKVNSRGETKFFYFLVVLSVVLLYWEVRTYIFY